MTTKVNKSRTGNPIHRVKEMLEHHGHECMRLAQDLGDDGRELKDFELRLIKVAMLPAIQEEYEVAIARYLTGGNMEPDFFFTEF